MSRSLFLWSLSLAVPLALVGTIPVSPSPALAAPAGAHDDKLVEKVSKSIDDGVKYLKSRQRKDGSWEVGPHAGSNPGGWTALALLALLTAGEKPTDPAVASGLAYLRKIPPTQTYVASLQTMVLALARDPEDRDLIKRNAELLRRARRPDGWSYGLKDGMVAGAADNSNTQYALLGLHEAIQAGFKVPEKDLEAIQKFYIATQKNGGWSYKAKMDGNTMTMTTAGLCNLVITGMDLAKGKAALRPDGSAENCGVYAENVPVARALDWVGSRFPGNLTEADATARFTSPYYCLYGIERVGRLTGQRFLGGHDWYEVGCRFLVDVQKADGHWEGADRPGQLDHWDVIATSFALLFLGKGKTPVLISKLAYGAPESTGWNNKRNDMRHLVEFASQELFKGQPLAWQAFDVRTREANTVEARRELAAELLASPIVYFNGHDIAPRDKEEEILKEYVTNGGFILAENCCGKDRYPGFDRDFRGMIARILPDAELKPLEKEHPIWLGSGKFAVSPRDFPLEGVKMGCKTVVVYSPVPLAGYWEANQQDSERGRKAFQIGANIIAYATGLEAPQPRLTRFTITADDPREKVKRGFVQVAQLRHEGDWQPAPQAMRTLMIAARKEGLDVALRTQPVAPSSRQLPDYRFFYMHGRNEFHEKKEDLKKLRFVLEAGGTLLADSCCGSAVFDRAFRGFIKDLFAEDGLKLEPIPVTDELYGAQLNGTAIRTVNRRVRGPGGKVEPTFQALPPALEGVRYKGRWVVIYSKNDIGCALEKHTSPDCVGHDHESALRLARAALLYALIR